VETDLELEYGLPMTFGSLDLVKDAENLGANEDRIRRVVDLFLALQISFHFLAYERHWYNPAREGQPSGCALCSRARFIVVPITMASEVVACGISGFSFCFSSKDHVLSASKIDPSRVA
jgi:hypothetical protein